MKSSAVRLKQIEALRKTIQESGGEDVLSTFKSQALSAKVRARFGKCLTNAQYTELLNKRSVSEMIGWLKNQPNYSEVLKDVQESVVHRGQVEQLLRRNVFQEYLELLRYDFSGKSSYYRHRIRKIEIDQILQMLQALNSGDVQDYVNQLPSFASPYLKFDLMRLSTATDFDSLLSLLPRVPYEAILKPLRPAPGEQIDYCACEKALYTYYYKELYRLLNRSFKGKTRAELTIVLSTTAQLMNLESIYRLKKFYNMSPEVLETYLLPVEAVNPTGNVRQGKLFRKMLEADTPEEVLEKFMASSYGKYVGDVNQLEGGVIEYAGQCIRYRFSMKKLFFSTSAPTIFTSYIALLELETQNLITILEGLHYGIPANEISKMLVSISGG